MLTPPKHPEIDYRTLKLLIGLIALSLAYVTNLLAGGSLPSISASYYETDAARNIFVGFLFAIFAFLLAYNGKSISEMILSKIASLAAFGIAVFPCKCEIYPEPIPGLHGAASAIMFVALAGFCWIFFRRAYRKGHPEAKMRAYLYAACGIVIVAAILVLSIDGLTNGKIKSEISNIIFYGERAGLIAFSISWLTASHVFPFINNKQERFIPF